MREHCHGHYSFWTTNCTLGNSPFQTRLLIGLGILPQYLVATLFLPLLSAAQYGASI